MNMIEVIKADLYSKRHRNETSFIIIESQYKKSIESYSKCKGERFEDIWYYEYLKESLFG